MAFGRDIIERFSLDEIVLCAGRVCVKGNLAELCSADSRGRLSPQNPADSHLLLVAGFTPTAES